MCESRATNIVRMASEKQKFNVKQFEKTILVFEAVSVVKTMSTYLLEQLLKSFLILCCVTSVSSLEELSNEAIFFSTKYSILMNGYIDGISPEKVFSNFLSL